MEKWKTEIIDEIIRRTKDQIYITMDEALETIGLSSIDFADEYEITTAFLEMRPDYEAFYLGNVLVFADKCEHFIEDYYADMI